MASSGAYRDDHEAALARCEVLEVENTQLRHSLLETKDALNRAEVDRDIAGNLVGELSHRARRNGAHPLWVVTALVSFMAMAFWYVAFIVKGCTG